MIQAPPVNWRDFQSVAAQILIEAGVTAKTDQVANTARGPVNIDVLAVDDVATPSQEYFLECKYWSRRVPKTVVHAFRTVVGDSGANWGAIVALNGFQHGAIEAARYSNVRLLTWSQFEMLFARRWFNRYFLRAVSTEGHPFVEYTEPINSRIARRASALTPERQRQYLALRQKHEGLQAFCVLFNAHSVLGASRLSDDPERDELDGFPQLPLRRSLPKLAMKTGVAAEVLDAEHLRDLLTATGHAISEAVSEFDSVFGERA